MAVHVVVLAVAVEAPEAEAASVAAAAHLVVVAVAASVQADAVELAGSVVALVVAVAHLVVVVASEGAVAASQIDAIDVSTRVKGVCGVDEMAWSWGYCLSPGIHGVATLYMAGHALSMVDMACRQRYQSYSQPLRMPFPLDYVDSSLMSLYYACLDHRPPPTSNVLANASVYIVRMRSSMFGVKVNHTTRLDHACPVVHRSCPNVRIQFPIIHTHLFGERQPLPVQVLAALLGPLKRKLLILIHDSRALLLKMIPRRCVGHLGIFIALRLGVRVVPILFATEFLGNVRDWNDLRKLMDILCEAYFRSNDWIEPSTNNLPDSLENPRRFVNKHVAKRFGIISFKALDHEFNRTVILPRIRGSCVTTFRATATYHVRHGEVSHVKDNDLNLSVHN